MSLALYRKYRPQKFEDITDQNHVKITLQNEIASGKISHAYLFTGPRGVGKTTTARIFAKAINCEARTAGKFEPCGVCASCTLIAQGATLDIMEMDAASQTGVDNVRENIIENVRVAPSRLKYKVFIIDEVHMLSTASFNALLKTLEEPPQHAVFILATTELHKIPATIVSRTERYDFKKIPLKELVQRLVGLAKAEGVLVSSEVLENIARQSEGCLRDAESLLGQVLSLAGENAKEVNDDEAAIVIPRSNFGLVAECVGYISRKQSKEALAFVSRIEYEGVNLLQFASDTLEFLRKMMFVKVSSELATLSQYFGKDIEEKMVEDIKVLSLEEILRMTDRLIETRQAMRNKNIEKLVLEMALIELAERVSQTSVVPEAKVAVTHQPAPSFQEKKEVKTPVVAQPTQAVESEKKTEKIAEAKPKAVREVETIEVKSAAAGTLATSLDEIVSQWRTVIEKAGEKNGSFTFVLKMGKPLEIRGDELVIGFQYGLHKDRANDAKNRVILEEVLKEVFHERMRVVSEVADIGLSKTEETGSMAGASVTEKSTNTDDSVLSEVLKEFGGKVVE